MPAAAYPGDPAAGYDLGDVDVDDTTVSADRYTDVDTPGTRVGGADLQQLLSTGFTQERQRLERRHTLAARQLDELETFFDDVRDRHAAELQRVQEEIRPLARRKNDVASTDEAQQQVLDRLERLYDAALDLRLEYEDRRRWYLDRKQELQEQRVDAVEALEELAAARQTIDHVLDADR